MSTDREDICRFAVLVKAVNTDGSYRLLDAECERELGHIGLHVIPEPEVS